MGVLAEARVLPNTGLLALMQKLQDRQQFDAALALGEWLRQDSRTLGADYAVVMARMAEAAERWDLARHYLELAVGSPTPPGRYQGVYDPFLYSLGALARTARSRQERDAALEKAWRHLQKTPDSDMTELRRAAVAGVAGGGGAGGGAVGSVGDGGFSGQSAVGESAWGADAAGVAAF
jgi:hypothetical protein